MPVVKTDIVSIKNEGGDFGIKITFNVNSSGEFYCGIPELLADAYTGRGTFTEQASRYSANGRIINNFLFSNTLDGLYAELREALLACPSFDALMQEHKQLTDDADRILYDGNTGQGVN